MDQLELPALFAALDLSLSLHYLTSTTDPTVQELCTSATSLSNRRIGRDAVERVLGVDTSVWTVWFSAPRDSYCIGPPPDVTAKALSAALEQRKTDFRKSFEGQPQAAPAELGAVAGTPRDLKARAKIARDNTAHVPVSRDKVAKARASLSNTNRRFALKADGGSGLSLLERIKLKEKANKSRSTPEAAYKSFIQGKLPAVYDILYELSGAEREKSLPFPKAVSIIIDSTSHSISDTEVADALASISRSLPNKVSILHIGEIKALKISALDRDKDLALLEKPLG